MLVDAECTHDGSVRHLAKFGGAWLRAPAAVRRYVDVADADEGKACESNAAKSNGAESNGGDGESGGWEGSLDNKGRDVLAPRRAGCNAQRAAALVVDGGARSADVVGGAGGSGGFDGDGGGREVEWIEGDGGGCGGRGWGWEVFDKRFMDPVRLTAVPQLSVALIFFFSFVGERQRRSAGLPSQRPVPAEFSLTPHLLRTFC